jgi:hypothetical protein
MPKLSQVLPVLAIAAVSLAGCSGAANTDVLEPVPAETAASDLGAEASDSATDSSTSTNGPVAAPLEKVDPNDLGLNEHGNVPKSVGELAELTDYSGESLYQFTVTAIDVDIECNTGWAEPPANGHYIGIEVDMTTAPLLAEQDIPEVWLDSYAFTVLSPDGTQENDSAGNSYTCLEDADTFPMQVGPGQRAKGTIVLDSAHTSGSIVYREPGAAGGWEWGF